MSFLTMFDEPGPRARRRHRILEVISGLAMFAIVIVAVVALSSHDAFSKSAWSPFAQWGVWRLIGLGLLNNVTAAITAMILSMLVGCLLAFGLLSTASLLRHACQAFTAVFNCVPILLLLFFTSLMLPAWGLQLTDFWFLVIALTLYSGAVIGDLLRAGIQSLPAGQSEAAMALGFSPARTMLLVLLPQALRAMSPALVSQLVIIFKGTALAYVLGSYVELLHTATLIGSYFSQSSLQSLVVAAILFMVVNIGLSVIARAVERRERRRFGYHAPEPDALPRPSLVDG